MTTMARCLEGHPFDTDVSATCPICGSTVWRDAVKEAAEKAAREAKETKAAKEAKEAREAAERIEKAKEAKAAKDKAAREDAAARAAQSVRDALEAQAARRAAERVEEEEQRKLAVDVVVPPGSPGSRAAGQADSSPHADAAADSAAADEAGGAATKARGAESKASLWVGLLVIFVGLPTLLFGAYLLVESSQMAAVYRQFGKNQPDNTTLENVMHTALLELRHGFQARVTDVPYGPNAGGFGRDGLVAVDPTGEPTRRVPLSAIRDAITRPTPVSPETSPRTMPNPFATPNR